jgi:2-dehydro-3-deoxy-D-arabinonate dehydratase
MRIAKYQKAGDDDTHVGLITDDRVIPLGSGPGCLTQLIYSKDLVEIVRDRAASGADSEPLGDIQLLAPLDRQEVWGAGVTFERSKKAREEESDLAAQFYDRVYTASRPELFFKATPNRVVGPGQSIRIRRDTNWCVPEPELALVLSPSLELIGYTIGDDVSSRDIEGENPLYLPQAKMYDSCCALGPWITLTGSMPAWDTISIHLDIARAGSSVFQGKTPVTRMARTLPELIGWLGIDNSFPDGVILLTGTGIIPPDEFTLQAGDVVTMRIDGIGTLTNTVVQHR